MKALILAAGYATRLYPLTKDRPKPLLPVADKPIIEHIAERIARLEDVTEIVVVVNNKFADKFIAWKEHFSVHVPIAILDDGSRDDADKLGAIRDLEFAIKAAHIDDDLLVIAGDNLFDAELAGFIGFAKGKAPAASIALYDVKELELAKQYGVVEKDEQERVLAFTEKPPAPKTTLAAICMYYFPEHKLGKVSEYLQMGNQPDAPGYYISWLCKENEVYAYTLGGIWYDIGDIASYEEAKREFR